MKETTTNLEINLHTDCPKCGFYIDLVSDTDLNEEGWLLDQVLPSEGIWIEEHKKFETKVLCHRCKEIFLVKGINW